MDWTVLVLHAFWDSWIHERDVLLAHGTDHPTSGDATAYAAAYGLFIAAAVASMLGDQVRQQLTRAVGTLDLLEPPARQCRLNRARQPRPERPVRGRHGRPPAGPNRPSIAAARRAFS